MNNFGSIEMFRKMMNFERNHIVRFFIMRMDSQTTETVNVITLMQ